MAIDLNQVIREAADEYKEYGVFWVDSYIDKFKDHRFCSPTGLGRDYDSEYHSNYNQDKGSHTWFWGMSSGYSDGDEGPPFDQIDMLNQTTPNVTKIIFEHLKIDETGQAKLAQGLSGEHISPAFKDLETFEKAISDIEVKDNNGKVVINLNDGWNRVFHPKGTALEVIANSFFDVIVEQRDWTFDKNDVPTSAAPQPTQPTPSSKPTEPENPMTGKTLTVGLQQEKECWDVDEGVQHCKPAQNTWFFFFYHKHG